MNSVFCVIEKSSALLDPWRERTLPDPAAGRTGTEGNLINKKQPSPQQRFLTSENFKITEGERGGTWRAEGGKGKGLSNRPVQPTDA